MIFKRKQLKTEVYKNAEKEKQILVIYLVAHAGRG